MDINTQANNTQDLLAQRGQVYGSYKENATTAQQLKTHVRMQINYGLLSPSQREALEMILHKVARIVNGNPNYIDSWRDIAGYAQLVIDEMQQDSQTINTVTTHEPMIPLVPNWLNEG